MDYKRIYDDLMQSRLLMKEDRIKLRRGGDYFEAHHIIPKSMGGLGCVKNLKHANIVLLTGREHYLAHALLFLVYRNREMAYAFKSMCTQKNSGRRNYAISSRMYEYIKHEINRLGVSPETREKIRQVHLGKKLSPEHVEILRQASLGRKRSPETREKMRQIRLNMSPETREKIRQANLGKTHNLGKKRSPETREKIRQTLLGRKSSPETREKIRQARLGKKHTPEAIEKMRQAKLGKTNNLGKKLSPESIKKREETRKRNRLLKLAQLNGDIDWSRWEEKK